MTVHEVYTPSGVLVERRIDGRLVGRWTDAGVPLYRADDTTRRVTRWDEDGNVVSDDDYSPAEIAEAEALATETRRQARYATLLERAETAQQDNRDSRTTLAQIATAASFTTAQRDNAIRYLAGRVDALTVQNTALMQLVLSLAGRFAALDAAD